MVKPGCASRVADQLSTHLGINQVNDRILELDCAHQEKMSVLRQITDLGDTVLDVSIATPRLDDIYLHFMNEEQR